MARANESVISDVQYWFHILYSVLRHITWLANSISSPFNIYEICYWGTDSYPESGKSSFSHGKTLSCSGTHNLWPRIAIRPYVQSTNSRPALLSAQDKARELQNQRCDDMYLLWIHYNLKPSSENDSQIFLACCRKLSQPHFQPQAAIKAQQNKFHSTSRISADLIVLWHCRAVESMLILPYGSPQN
jgi:hypothetical protein